MIEFNGTPTGDCKKFLLKKQTHINFIFMLYVFVIFSAIIITLAITLHAYYILWFLLFFGGLLLISLLPPDKSAQKGFMPNIIFLDLKEETIVHKCEKMERFHMISSVKSVIDYGDWYYFIFNFGDRDPYFVCQKNLLAKGTLEEFEALFEDKIERRIRKSDE